MPVRLAATTPSSHLARRQRPLTAIVTALARARARLVK